MEENFKKLSKMRYDALTYAKSPIIHEIIEEIEYYCDREEKLIGVLFRDKIDNDFGFVIMARNSACIFTCIDQESSFKNINEAKKSLKIALSKNLLKNNEISSPDSKKSIKNDIFHSDLPDKSLNEYFLLLRDNEGYSPAKGIIQEIAYTFVDCDGTFIRDFQTTKSGFNSRLWELYLYAYLKEEYFFINREYSSPDYFFVKYGAGLGLEAMTVNLPDNISEDNNIDDSFSNNLLKYNEHLILKYGKVMVKKLNKKYWEKPHIQGKPLIFAVQGFHNKSNFKDNSLVANYIYGVRHLPEKDKLNKFKIKIEKIENHEHERRKIKSGFFFSQGSEHISAVLFSNSATISKFNRIGKLAGFGSPRVRMIREGLQFNPDPNAVTPKQFSVPIDSEHYKETWAQGLSMYHNPKAFNTVDPNFFPTINHHYFQIKSGEIISHIANDFDPITSTTLIFLD